MNVSGLYERQDSADTPFTSESVRLDVDNHFPQMTASGTGFAGLQTRVHWVARPLTKTTTAAGDEWSGPIAHKFGTTSQFPFDTVTIAFVGGQIRATFQRAGMPDRVRDFAFQSPHFREVTFEYDAEENVGLVLDYQTDSHADRPAGLAGELLTLDTVFERAGFHVLRSGQDGVVPSVGANANARWSDNEMHDAMQVHFSRLAALPPAQRDRARWALWTFFATLYQEDPGDPDGSTGGIMFDSIGAAQRQGTAIFRDSFIARAPANDPTPDTWRRRMAFWTAAHEMGHAFNLLHAWQKHRGTPWISQPSGFHLLTFMNYPYFYQTGFGGNQDANTVQFFRDFGFRFTDDELLFMRHAPERFVIMGGEAFATNHAFEQARVAAAPALVLEVRVNRQPAVFDFLEPVVIELKLTNMSKQPVLLPSKVLRRSELITAQVARRGGPVQTFHPFAHYCFEGSREVLDAGRSWYDSMFLSVDRERWLIDAPGHYTIQVCLHQEDEDVVSNALLVRVVPPRGRDEEYVAQDFFSEDVGRALTFDGTNVLTSANDALREVADRFPESNAAIHARVSLELPGTIAYKSLDQAGDNGPGRYVVRAREASAKALGSLSELLGDPKVANQAARSLGHIDYRYYAERCEESWEGLGAVKEARVVGQSLHDTLKARNVAPHVLDEIAESVQALGAEKGGPPVTTRSGKKRRGKSGGPS